MNLSVARKIHLVGIGGIGMSALARHLAFAGKAVDGTDLLIGDATLMLEKCGIEVRIGHDASMVADDVDLLVRTTAVPDDNPEIVAARRRGIPILDYPDALAELLTGKESVAVAGCHGKTTTTAMTAWILDRAGLSPRAVVGGLVPQFSGNVLLGRGPAFVTEACEHRRAFHRLLPRHAVITNIGADHLDYYRDIDEIRAAFVGFARRVAPGGILAMHRETFAEDAGFGDIPARVVLVGDRAGDQTIERTTKGVRFRFIDGSATPEFRLRVPGRHNIMNAALAALMAKEAFGVSPEVIASALSIFGGVGRRFEVLFDVGDMTVVDDYAHHPDEISATLTAAREVWPDRRLVAIFQPHLESRTQKLFEPFVDALSEADMVLCVDDYRVAGRDVVAGVGSQKIACELRRRSRSAVFSGGLRDSVECALFHSRPGDVMLVMGAGDVREVSLELARRIS